MTFKIGDKVKATRDVALGVDVVIRDDCPGRVGQHIGALSHTSVQEQLCLAHRAALAGTPELIEAEAVSTLHGRNGVAGSAPAGRGRV